MTSDQPERLVVVGGGMAGFGLCQRLVQRGFHKHYQICIFGEEPRPAYDRVNISKLFSERSAEDLLLAPKDWYANNGIQLHTDRRIDRIDRESRTIFDTSGRAEPYNRLVIATGSRPWVPPIPGADSSGVFVYRTIDDLESIREFVQGRNAQLAAVIGGGLLGLEAAQVMLDLGLKASIIEVAPGLMPRQLGSDAAKVLKRRVEQLGVDVHVTRRTDRIAAEREKLRLDFANADSLRVDIVIVAAGIRPRDELADACGLPIGARGGIEVNKHLATCDRHIFAIGECASIDDRTYGLVAPCYRMAEVLAAQLSGQEAEFEGVDESAELKLLGVPVVALGRAIGESTSGIVVTNESERGFRRLILERGRLVGAVGVGQWDDLDHVRLAIAKRKRLWPHQIARFTKTGSPFVGDNGNSIRQWPGDAVVCACLGVTRDRLGQAMASGAETEAQMSEMTGAATACGGCKSLLRSLAGAPQLESPIVGAKTVLVSSFLAIALSLSIVVLPPIEFATSVQDGWRAIDVLWRDSFAKQISGFTLLAIILIALTFSLRKRTSLVSRGNYGRWRAAHAALGTALLVGLVVHTGLRMGSNLNFWLSSIFIGLSVMGGLAGIASSVEPRLSGEAAIFIRTWRPKLTKLHICLFGPLPVLVAVHVFCVYWY